MRRPHQLYASPARPRPIAFDSTPPGSSSAQPRPTMTCDYEAIRRANKRRYGEDIARVGKLLLADRYGDRTHFIYELLQNAEDALRRRPPNWNGSRTVSFDLDSNGLRVTHFGDPFSEDDVRAICGIGQNQRKRGDLTAIGQFGIGFKSVYAFTDRPEIRSGTEEFAIEHYVRPVAAKPLKRGADETIISIPFKKDGRRATASIANWLSDRRGVMRSLLFLRGINRIQLHLGSDQDGAYTRQTHDLEKAVRRVYLTGKTARKGRRVADWLLFSRPIQNRHGHPAGLVEIAWLTEGDRDGKWRIRGVERSPLSAFFPTVEETDLGFLVQGPYRTTLTRDSVPHDDDWNRRCAHATAELLIEALGWLRDHDLLDAAALACLPLKPPRFKPSMFRVLFERTKTALKCDDLLPAAGGTYTGAAAACIADSDALRGLLSSDQLSALFGETKAHRWLDRTISRNRGSELHGYLTRTLGVPTRTPKGLVGALKRCDGFLPAQGDEWILALYEFLGTQRALHRELKSVPIIRLEDGSHVRSGHKEEQAFLPGHAQTDFPTVRSTVCQTRKARDFLKALGLTKPDDVDHTLRYVLPKYRHGTAQVSSAQYSADLERVVAAYKTASLTKRRLLLAKLKTTPWVRCVAGTGRRTWATPEELCLFSEELRSLFDGVDTVLFSDPDVDDLSRDDMCRLLRGCGASEGLILRETGDLSEAERRQLRKKREHQDVRVWKEEVKVKTIHGLEALIALLPTLGRADRAGRSRDLWEALRALIERRGSGAVESVYSWEMGFRPYRVSFDAEFVDTLNAVKWVADAAGELRHPSVVTFDSLGWEASETLSAKIRFKQVQEAGGEGKASPGVLAVLEETGLATDATKLLERLEVSSGVAALLREEGLASDEGKVREAVDLLKKQAPGTDRDGASQVSVVGQSVAGPDEGSFDDRDPSEQKALRDLEDAAIEFIREQEPEWKKAPFENRGFDLYRGDSPETASHRCEVKAIARSMGEKIPTLSRTQFVEFAQKYRRTFSLYIVERADKEDAKLVKIRDPAARTVILDTQGRGVAWVGSK